MSRASGQRSAAPQKLIDPHPPGCGTRSAAASVSRTTRKCIPASVPRGRSSVPEMNMCPGLYVPGYVAADI